MSTTPCRMARVLALVALIVAARGLQTEAEIKSDENLAIFSKYTKIPVETLKTMDPYAYAPDLAPHLETLMDMQQVFIEQGQLKLSAPIPPERWADASFVKGALALLP